MNIPEDLQRKSNKKQNLPQISTQQIYLPKESFEGKVFLCGEFELIEEKVRLLHGVAGLQEIPLEFLEQHVHLTPASRTIKMHGYLRHVRHIQYSGHVASEHRLIWNHTVR